MFYRVSTSQMQQSGLDTILKNQAIMNDVMGQISTGVRTDLSPIEIAQKESYSVRISNLAQNVLNAQRIEPQIQLQETTARSINETLIQMKELMIQSQNPAIYQKPVFHEQWNTLTAQLSSLVDAKDTLGNYVFAGYSGNTKPFPTLTGAYAGDQGVRKIQIAEGVMVDVNIPGDQLVTSNVVDSINKFDNFIATGTSDPTMQDSINKAIDDVSLASTKYGLALNQLDTFTDINKNESANKEAYVSKLSKADLPSLIAKLNQAKTGVEAAMKSYVIIQNLSLFNYM